MALFYLIAHSCVAPCVVPVLGNADAEVKLQASVENLELSKFPSFKSPVGQNIPLHASRTVKNYVFLMLPSRFILLHFFQSSSNINGV